MRNTMFLLALLALQTEAQESLEMRVRQLEARINSDVLAQMYHKLQQLEEEVKRLRGRVEQLSKLERRIDHLEARLQSSPDRSPQPTEFAPVETAFPAPSVEAPPAMAVPQVDDPIAEAEEYRRAYALLEAGRYDEAITAFKAFLQRFPMGSYAPNAYYWLGEAHYAQRRFDRAKEAFQTVLERFPTSHKAGDAKLKLGFVAYEEGNYEEAKRILAEVAREYPGTRLARLALQRIEEIRQKKHIR